MYKKNLMSQLMHLSCEGVILCHTTRLCFRAFIL